MPFFNQLQLFLRRRQGRNPNFKDELAIFKCRLAHRADCALHVVQVVIGEEWNINILHALSGNIANDDFSTAFER